MDPVCCGAKLIGSGWKFGFSYADFSSGVEQKAWSELSIVIWGTITHRIHVWYLCKHFGFLLMVNVTMIIAYIRILWVMYYWILYSNDPHKNTLPCDGPHRFFPDLPRCSNQMSIECSTIFPGFSIVFPSSPRFSQDFPHDFPMVPVAGLLQIPPGRSRRSWCTSHGRMVPMSGVCWKGGRGTCLRNRMFYGCVYTYNHIYIWYICMIYKAIS